MTRVTLLGRCSGGVVAWRRGDARFLTVVLKATYSIAEDGAMVTVDPQSIALEELHYDGQPTRSVCQPSDVAPFKPKADVLLLGHAYAPPDEEVATTVVRLSLSRGSTVLVNKTLDVAGDLVDGAHVAFERMPIDFEHAFGGPGTDDNPIGGPEPNVLHRCHDRAVACYGPISEWWPVRRTRLGDASREAVAGVQPHIPEEFDWSYFQLAPPDQQTGFLEGNEQIILDGLHPKRQHSTHVLPGVRGLAAVFDLDGPRSLVALDADTMLIEPDADRVTIVWRGVIDVPEGTDLDEVLVVGGVASDDESIVLPDARGDVEDEASDRSLMRKSEPQIFDRTVTVDGSLSAVDGAPFELAPAADTPSSESATPPSTPWAEAAKSDIPPLIGDLSETLSLDADTLAMAPVRDATPEPVPAPAPPEKPEEPTVTEDGVPVRWVMDDVPPPPDSEPVRVPEKAPKVPELPQRAVPRKNIYSSLAAINARKDQRS